MPYYEGTAAHTHVLCKYVCIYYNPSPPLPSPPLQFSLAYYESYVMPQTQMSFAYSFAPSESFYARPFGLVVNMYYRDLEGGEFRDAVFNSTVTIVELEEGYDAET